MIPAAFEYLRAHSVDEAFAHLQQHGGEARVLAGGQSLIPAMRFRLARPAVLVDINAVRELNYIRPNGNVLAIGAIARDSDIERAPWITERRWSLLHDVSRVVADPVVRQMGTVVGSLCHNDPAGDWTATALAARAEVVVRGKAGTRTVAIDDFLVDSFATAVGEGEMALGGALPSARRSHGRLVPEGRAQGRRLRHRRGRRAGLVECGRHDPQRRRGAVGGGAVRRARRRGRAPARRPEAHARM